MTSRLRASGPPAGRPARLTFHYLGHMSELMKADVEEGTYFVTLTVVGWIDVFIRPSYCAIIFESLEYCRRNKGLEVFEYALLPSHLHMIIRRKHGLLSDVLRDFKSFAAKKLLDAIAGNDRESRREWMMKLFRDHGRRSAQNTELMFWQKTNHPELIQTPAFYLQKAQYIRNNPVVMGLVTEAEHYAWSSAHPRAPLVTDVA